MKKLFFLLFTLTVSYPALAVQFSFVYNDTIRASTTIPGLSAGQSAAITVTLDNGGTSLNGQTWSAADLQSVTFDFGNGVLVTTFSFPFDDGLEYTSGSFQTNASGTVTAVMSNWGDFGMGTTNAVTNGATPVSWYLNGDPDVFYNADGRVELDNTAGITNAANWSLASATAIPEPSLVLPLLFAVALLWWRSRRSPAVSAAVYA